MNSGNRGSIVRAVLDTNVIVSALMTPRGVPADVYRSAYRGEFHFVSSALLLDELQRVFSVKLGMSLSEAARLRGRVARSAEIVPLHTQIGVFPPGHGDNVVLATAVDGSADYVVTGDARHLLPLRSFQGCRIVTPREFFTLIA